LSTDDAGAAARADRDEPIINLLGEKVALGPYRRELLPRYHKWINDFEVARTISPQGARPVTLEAEAAWYERATTAEDQRVFTIYERATWRPIGSTGLYHVDLVNQTAEFAIWIGEKDCWGKGYGTETARLMLDYAFTTLGLHSVWLKVMVFHERAVRAYQRAGFQVTGRRREGLRSGGRFYGVVMMDCLADEVQGNAV
jgi:diamine N-acetyltransferase